MPLYPASRNGPRLRIDTKAHRVIRKVQLVESISESVNLEYELTYAVTMSIKIRLK